MSEGLSEKFIQEAIANELCNETCRQIHPQISCNLKMLQQFQVTCGGLYKTYLLVYLIPFFIFKRKKVMQQPWKQIKQLLFGFIKSMLFVGGFMVIVRRTICFVTEHYRNTSLGALLGAFLGGFALCIEQKGRQAQTALYCLNKTLETGYQMLMRRGYKNPIPYGECILLGLGAALICYLYVDCPRAFQSKYRKVLDRLIGSI